MASVFSKIAAGEIPSFKVLEDEKHLAFLDISPLAEGHTLVIPKKETDYIFDLPDNELQELMVFSKKVAMAINMALPCERVGVAVIGLEVPHVHVHLVPINEVGDINFQKKKLNPSKEKLNEVVEKIKAAL